MRSRRDRRCRCAGVRLHGRLPVHHHRLWLGHGGRTYQPSPRRAKGRWAPVTRHPDAVANQRAERAEAHVDRAAHVALPAGERRVSPQPGAQAAGEEHVPAVGDDGQHHEDEAQEQDLRRHRRARRIGELRQEREEEERRLRVQHRHHERLAQDVALRRGRGRGVGLRDRRAAVEHPPHAEEHEVAGPEVPHEGEGHRRRREDRREAERRRGGVDRVPEPHPQHRQEPGAPPEAHAARDDEQHRRAWRERQGERGPDEERELRRKDRHLSRGVYAASAGISAGRPAPSRAPPSRPRW